MSFSKKELNTLYQMVRRRVVIQQSIVDHWTSTLDEKKIKSSKKKLSELQSLLRSLWNARVGADQ